MIRTQRKLLKILRTTNGLPTQAKSVLKNVAATKPRIKGMKSCGLLIKQIESTSLFANWIYQNLSFICSFKISRLWRNENRGFDALDNIFFQSFPLFHFSATLTKKRAFWYERSGILLWLQENNYIFSDCLVNDLWTRLHKYQLLWLPYYFILFYKEDSL